MTSTSLPSKSPSITIQRLNGAQLDFKIGEAAAQLHTKLLHCPLWVEDLRSWSAVATITGVVSIFFAAYCVAVVEADAWPIVLLQALFVVLGPIWWFASWKRSERALKWTLYMTVTALILSASALLLWLSVYTTVREKKTWLWWVLLGVQLVQVLTVLSASIALANIYDARLTSDLNVTFHRAVDMKTRQHRECNNNPHTELGSGAVAMSDASAKLTPGKKTHDLASKNK